MPDGVRAEEAVQRADGRDDQARALATLVVPTYNAVAFIAVTIERLRGFLLQHPEWRVLFVCDGCTDATPDVLQEAAFDTAGLDVLVHARNRGKGYAVRSGFAAATTPYAVFTDVDLAYDLEDACRVLALLQAGADMVVADRTNPDTQYCMSPRDLPTVYRRHLMSRAYNAWVRRMLPITVRDTQAGLKGLSRAAWEQLASVLHVDGFAFDVELLARAGQAGLRIVETPVAFRYVDPTTVVMLRHGREMFIEVLRLRRALRRYPVGAQSASSSVPVADRP
jgi:dolichyl-phosphate beta-glucosyltransferase